MLPAMPELFHRLPRNVIRIFSGWNFGWHALAIVLTIVIVRSDFDWSYYLATRGEAFSRLAWPAVGLGGLVPLLGVLFLLLVGAVMRNRRLLTTTWALGQAALLGYLISTGYKAFTGRRPPLIAPPFIKVLRMPVPNPALPNPSHGFQLGFLKGGLFWGWPSSHTTIAFAMAFCLIRLYPRNQPLVGLALIYALGIGLGVSVTIHWFSEFVAGAIIGSVIGWVVGGSFKSRLAERLD
jgi:membrane-associated phospholipid phosphatase